MGKMIAEVLGPEGFAILRGEDIERMDSVLAGRDLSDGKVRDVFVASCAELAIWMQTSFGKLGVLLDINPSLMTTVEYKCNTISHTRCKPHIQTGQNHDEYAFLFVSDCWKVRRLLADEDVLGVLVSNPQRIAEAIDPHEWTFAVNDSMGIAKDLSVMLWSAKALTLTGVNEFEARGRLITYAQQTNLGARVPGMRIIEPETV
jgi:hypothetical protein